MDNQESAREEMEIIRRMNRNLLQDLDTYRDQTLNLKFKISELEKEVNERDLLLKYAKNSLSEIAESTRNEAIYSLQESYHQNYIN